LDEDQHQILYLELRAEAALHAKLRAESFMKAAHARSKKQYEVAQYYAQQVSGCGHA
jgi:NEDD4-binding protein 2